MSKQLSYLSYGKILQDLYNFKKSGTVHGNEFNLYDMPGHKYFKILFYFGGMAEDETNDSYTSGLLAPTWELFNERESMDDAGVTFGMEKLNYYDYNSAWAYLKNNDENERAYKLEQFVTLLSNINSESPWYFSSVGGLQEALERKQVTDDKMEIGERKKLSLTCLPDAYDNRITTLLELYRDITWSWSLKKEIIPANLRKFDMAIYLFEAPERDMLDTEKLTDMPTIDGSSGFMPSYKMIEFHNCEFDYNSIKSGWGEVNNQTGFNPTYTIDIMYDDCYDISYNEHAMLIIGDVIKTDTWQAVISDGVISDPIKSTAPKKIAGVNDKTETPLVNKSDEILNLMPSIFNPKIVTFGNLSKRNGQRSDDVNIEYKTYHNTGFIGNAAGQIVGTIKADIKSMVKKAILGNIHTYSLTDIKDTIKGALQGNLIPTLERAGVNMASLGQKGGESVKDFMKNIHGNKAQASSANDVKNGEIFNKPKSKPKNIFNASTIANNI